MRHTRLYATPDGESHFANSEIEFEPTEYVAGAVPLGLSQPMNASEVRFMEAPTGWSSDWHPSSGRNMFFVLSGKWEVTASDGETRRFGVGSALLVEDTFGKGHTSRVIGDVESVAVIVQLEP